MLFVPLTTATMDPIPKEEMGNATSMFNLMRNLGGSFGIAAATTYLFRRDAVPHQPVGRARDRLQPGGEGHVAGPRGQLWWRTVRTP